MKLLKLLTLCVIASVSMVQAYEIQPITQDDLPAARSIFYNAIYELQIIACTSVQEIIAMNGFPDMQDMDGVEQYYTNNRGCFLVIKQDGIVAGMGAVEKFDDQSCELRRVFFAPAYRGQGLGSALMQQLLQQAELLGYTRVLLEIWNAKTQQNAYNFYKKFGFYDIEPYKMSPAQIVMEKLL